MKNELTTLFPSIKILSEYPTELEEEVYIFHNPYLNNWLQINKSEVSHREYSLLSSLYSEVSLDLSTNQTVSMKWMNFLRGDGLAPVKTETDIRVIQIHFKKNVNEADLEEAVHVFFGDAMQFVFVSSQNALLIEEKSSYIQTTEDFASFIAALESDFFIKAKLYIGKFHQTNMIFPVHFSTEKEWFQKGISANHAERIYTLENIFPFNLIEQMSEEMKHIIRKEILNPIEYDMELLQTVHQFFENGFNASVTAKKLHIHRNTFHYRLTKFQDITGISVRSFDGALIAYCASLIANNR